MDLFREWDGDSTGTISREEFHRAMAVIQLDAPQTDIDALFDCWDPDGSGEIEFNEMYKQLRSGADITLGPVLQPGAAGKIETVATAGAYEIRKSKSDRGLTLMQSFQLGGDAIGTPAEQVSFREN